uniref:Putative ovule protein n=1 Tax=Solanum chacoense TaxID=4108 RepID=A0A0V0GJU2_SOLCH
MTYAIQKWTRVTRNMCFSTWSEARGPILKAKNLRKRRITYTSWCFTQVLRQRCGQPPFALPATYALVVGDFEMVRDKMDNANCQAL